MEDLIYTDDLIIRGGDFFVGFSEDQHVEHILRANVGQFYQHPDIGIGITDFTKASSSIVELKQKIRENLENDDFRILKLNADFAADGGLVLEIQAKKRK